MVQATSDTTTGEKNSVRKNVVPRSCWLSSTASSSARLQVEHDQPDREQAGGRQHLGQVRVVEQLLVVLARRRS